MDSARLEESSRDVTLREASYIFLPFQTQNRSVADKGCNHMDLVAALDFSIKTSTKEKFPSRH